MPKGKLESGSYLVEVTPITKAPTPHSLSYFSPTKLSVGTFIKVPIRKGLTLALVTRCRDVKSAKTEIRRAGFILRKIKKTDILEAHLTAERFTALEATARYHATQVGPLLSSLIPKVMSDEPNLFLPKMVKKQKKTTHTPETILLQMESEERFGQYRAQVRQSFAHGQSVMFVVPTHLEIDKAREELSKGINEFVYTFSLQRRKVELKKMWGKVLSEKHPVLLITTPAGLFFNRGDLGTIILDRENSRAYRTLNRPYLNLKIWIENLAKKLNIQLVIGDSVLSLETLWREKNHEFSENSLIRWRISASPTTLVDASTKQNEAGRFEIFSQELKDLINKAILEKQGVFLFGARKGLAPTTVCGDCGFILPCLNCGAPVVLHQHNETTVYICHACRERRDSTTTCGYCGSWKLVPLGVGTSEIARQARELFPNQVITILDKDHATTDRQAKLIVDKFREKGGILIGTELAFFHLQSVTYSAVVSLDSLFSVPDFGINERIFYLVSRLREMTKVETLVQTRNIGKQILSWATQGNIIDFYQNEIEERQLLLYPPFAIFIKVTLSKRDAKMLLPKLKQQFEKWQPDTLEDSLIMRIPKGEWPEVELVQELALLPPQFSIKVDPESIL
jgi:primosomal protein N' (replication factor Y)